MSNRTKVSKATRFEIKHLDCWGEAVLLNLSGSHSTTTNLNLGNTTCISLLGSVMQVPYFYNVFKKKCYPSDYLKD